MIERPSWRYRCLSCGAEYEPTFLGAFCPLCRSVLAIEPLRALQPSWIVREEPTLWRYAACLPVPRPARTLGEGMTPLVPGQLDGESVLFKLDFLLPSGSFKDRGAAVVLAHLVQLGVRSLTVDSSGNAAAAYAAYAALHGVEARIFAPARTSSEKLAQVRAYGAAVVLVEGSREAVAEAAHEAARQEGAVYASHNWHPLFVEGTKTWLLEVWEQLDYRWPAACFVPVGGGSLLLGAELAVESVGGDGPMLIAAQPEACAPLAAAWRRRADDVEPVIPGETIADGARIAHPPRGRLLLDILRRRGWAEAVPEALLVDTVRQLWRQGLYVEPTAALGAAAYRAARRRGWSPPEGSVVILLTGSGLKTGAAVRRILEA